MRTEIVGFDSNISFSSKEEMFFSAFVLCSRFDLKKNVPLYPIFDICSSQERFWAFRFVFPATLPLIGFDFRSGTLILRMDEPCFKFCSATGNIYKIWQRYVYF